MTDSPLPIRLAQTVGLSLTLVQAGATLGISAFTVPRLLESPTPLMIRQWANTFTIGKAVAPPLAILSSLSYFYLSYAHSSYSSSSASAINLALQGNKALAYAVVGGLSVGIVPYTLLLMTPTNNKLLKKADEMRGLEKEDTVVEIGLAGENAHQLVDWWGVLNFGRGVMLSVAGVMGVWTALN